MKIQPETIANLKRLVDPEVLLNHLGFNLIKRSSKELRGPCTIHGGDNPTAFRFNVESKTWCCYSRHCEGDKHKDVIGLVQLVTKQTFTESVRFLADICGVDLQNQKQFSDEFRKIKQDTAMREEVRHSKPLVAVTSFFAEELVEELIPNRTDYFIERGFPSNLLDFYEIGGMVDGSGIQRETIPIRDEDGNLLTVSARRTDSDAPPKYVLMKNIPKEATLYNLHVAKHYTGQERMLILVEGFVDVWALSLLGVYNAIAAMGTHITTNQARLVWKYADNVIVMLDADDAGREATPKVVDLLKSGAGVRTIELKDGKDPKNFTYNDLQELGLGEMTYEL